MKFQVLIAALFAVSAAAFVPSSRQPVISSLKVSSIPDDDSLGNNIAVKTLLEDIESSGLLTKVAKSGLLSKAQKAGLTLSKLEPLLAVAAENKEVLILVEAATPDVLPLLPQIISIAPGALPLLASAISIPPIGLAVLGLASFGAAAGAVVLIPDDSLVNIATQTFAVGALGAAGVASLVGSVLLGKILK